MRKVLVWVWLCAAAVPVAAASGEKEVVAAVQQLFDAMAAHDEAALRSRLTPEGRIYAVRESQPVSVSTHGEFAARIAASKEALLERMWDAKVQVQGGLATLWAPYDFHRSGKLSHCGVDSIALIKTDGGWKIAGIFFTVTSAERCLPSPLGPPPK